jgi:hypothetical protein
LTSWAVAAFAGDDYEVAVVRPARSLPGSFAAPTELLANKRLLKRLGIKTQGMATEVTIP